MLIQNGKTVLVMGVAGFIGSNLAKRLFQEITDIGFKPSTSLRDGLRKFAEWYVKYQCKTF